MCKPRLKVTEQISQGHMARKWALGSGKWEEVGYTVQKVSWAR